MAVAMMYPKGTQGKATETSFATKEVDASRLSMARTVLRDSRAIAEEVMSGPKKSVIRSLHIRTQRLPGRAFRTRFRPPHRWQTPSGDRCRQPRMAKKLNL